MSDTPLGGIEITRTPITDQVIAETNRALDATAGHVSAAARLLNVKPERVYNIINSDPSMRAKWSKSKSVGPVAGTEVLDRPEAPPALAPAVEAAVAMIGQETKLTKSLSRLGFSKKEVNAISEFESFAGQHFQESLKILHGGMLKNAMSLMILAEQIRSEYLFNEDIDPITRDRWWDLYFKTLEEIRLMNDQANKAALTQAMIVLKERESKEGRLGKPGLGPVMVQINNGAVPRAPIQSRQEVIDAKAS